MTDARPDHSWWHCDPDDGAAVVRASRWVTAGAPHRLLAVLHLAHAHGALVDITDAAEAYCAVGANAPAELLVALTFAGFRETATPRVWRWTEAR